MKANDTSIGDNHRYFIILKAFMLATQMFTAFRMTMLICDAKKNHTRLYECSLDFSKFVPMSLPLTNHTLEKLEALLFAMGFKVRYEKGNFKTGSCLLEHNKVIVVNKFSNLEGKIVALVTLVKQTNPDENLLDEKQRQFFHSLQQTELF